MDKYEYLTGEDLALKPSTIEQTKFEYSPLGRIFNKRLDKDNKKEGLFKRMKNIKNAQKKLIRDNDKDDKDNKDKDKKTQQFNNVDTKPSNVFDYLKRLSEKAKDLMDEIKDVVDDIDNNKLLFFGRNKEKFNFNIFRMPLIFLSAIYNGEISLKEAEISQRNLEKKIEELKFNYRSENAEEKEEINGVLMQANDLLEYRNKIIDAFKDGTFSSERLKKSYDAAYDYVLEDINNFIQKIESMSENINPNLFKEFFELSLADYAKELINTKNSDENKKFVAEIKDRISDLKDRIKKNK